MNRNIQIIAGLLILIISINLVQANAEDYLNEFNELGETCRVVDYFVYEYNCPTFFNSQRYCSTVPTFYECCSEESCTRVIFDLENRKFLEEKYNSELIDLNYIKYYLKKGDLSEIQFELNEFDVCYPFGTNKIRQETINLAASTSETIAPILGAEKAREINTVVKSARSVGAVSKFNPAILAASISCSYDNKKLNNAIESLLNVNTYLSNIRNDYAKEGYIYGLTTNLNLAKNDLKIYTESLVSISKGAFDWLINVFRALFNLNVDEGLEIEKTDYQLAQEAYGKVLDYQSYLHNPNNHEIILAQNIRINKKVTEFNEEYESFNRKYGGVKEIKPSFFSISYVFLFKSPNYNLSEANLLLENSKKLQDLAVKDFKARKFNSASNKLIRAQEYLNQSETIYVRENNITRSFSLF